VMRLSTCHPDRKHHAKGLCRQCYYRTGQPHEQKLAYMRGYARKHASRISAYKKTIRERSNELKLSPSYRAKRNRRRRERKRLDPAWAMADRLRKRIGRAIRDYAPGRKGHNTATLIGCTVAELIAHLERQFLSGMSWENRRLWHIDHIKPCVSFDLSDPEQQRICFHYTNLRPLWAVENMKKHARILAVA
jgi:hypothetical protein